MFMLLPAGISVIRDKAMGTVPFPEVEKAGAVNNYNPELGQQAARVKKL
jgi:hypothetical protein